ncbi:type I restriction endonuclease [Macrococcus brunensis]|uniref:type I restriction endonuclease n=1 Tax=Macrococcus brunensis TaxID=198483 RepID=UPI003B8355C4
MGMEQFINNMELISQRVEKLKGSVSTEEATKTALVLPFFSTLGYDVFNPLEFTPEFIADVGIKKGEKVDYAIMENNEPVILIECKSVNEQLTNHDSQLFRYFGTSTSKFGILTNGIEYRFFTDLEEPNKMDSKPFLMFSITDLKDAHLRELFKFTKENFNVQNISSSAYELKYVNLIRNYLNEQMEDPNEDFVKHILNHVYEGVKTKAIIERFTPTVKSTFNQMMKDKVTDKLNAALNTTGEAKIKISDKNDVESLESAKLKNDTLEVITTPTELEAYAVIKVSLMDIISPERIHYRDNQSYFNILVDNNIRKWVVRAYLEGNNKKIVINDENKSTFSIESPMDIVNYKEALIGVVEKFV